MSYLTNCGAKVANTFPNFKSVLPAFALGTMLCCAGSAQAQITVSNTPDHTAFNSTGASIDNTGTDGITIYENEESIYNLRGNLQVMVWDDQSSNGTGPGFAWAGQKILPWSTAAAGFIALPNPHLEDSDPDVVVQKFGEESAIYAIVTYINSSHEVVYVVMKWNNTAFIQHSGPHKIGDNTPQYDYNYHTPGLNPNIDVNSQGKVVITWYESYSFPAFMDIQYPWGPYHIDFDVVRSEIYAVYGNVDGTSLSGSGTLTSVNHGTYGDQISETADLLYEHNIDPDVTIGEAYGEGYPITFTFTKKSFEPYPFRTRTDWVIDQRILGYSGTYLSDTGDFYYNTNVNPRKSCYRPRIASRKTQDDNALDFEAVTGLGGRSCDASGIHNSSIIYNAGLNHKVVTVNVGYVEEVVNQDPVVVYRYGSAGDNGEYIVAWEMDQPNGGAEFANRQVVAANMVNGVMQGSQFAYVNYGTSPSYPEMSGRQAIPSLAGRYCSAVNQYFYYDAHKGDAKYKGPAKDNPGSGVAPGPNPLKTAGGNDEPLEEVHSAEYHSDISTFPNPYTHEVRVRVTLEEEETPQSIAVYDMAGQKVADLSIVGLKEGVNNMIWKDRADLPAGMYMIRMATDRNVYTQKMLKQ